MKIEGNQYYTIDVLPLRDMVMFPHMVMPIIVGREQSITAVEKAMEGNRLIFLVAQKEASAEAVKSKDLFRMGTVGHILQVIKLPNNLIKVLTEGLNRARVKRYSNNRGMMKAYAWTFDESAVDDDHTEAGKRQLKALFSQYCKANDNVPDEVLFTAMQIENAAWLTDYISAYVEIALMQKQNLLKNVNLKRRIDQLIELLNKENHVLALKNELDVKVRDQMVKSQRNYYLQEQLRVIRDELGEENENEGDIAYLRKKIDEAKVPPHVAEKVDEELERLKKIPTLSPEYNVIRTYVDWIAALPWTTHTDDQDNIRQARSILESDHYGLVKPKERILEYISVLQRVDRMQGPILCLAGPPGVGKTSLGQSIARALGRKFTRISLGGVHDEAEIRGHRRTYIGSMPGKIIQGLKRAGSVNPVFLLDEVDKLGNDFRGDPASALLEVLDPEQNKTFIDHYLEVDYDLSNVLFLVTANNPNQIPAPLLDRSEIIELPGYMDFEKVEIFKRHLMPKQLSRHGLHVDEVFIEDSAVMDTIRHYTMEAGVRNLERELGKILRKAVVQLNGNAKAKSIAVKRQNLPEFLGEPRFMTQRLVSEGEIGVANGLAWTPYGGSLLRVEVNLLPGKEQLTLTGKLGDVMQESAKIALAYIRARQETFQMDTDIFKDREIHVHLPEGAIAKDGPSAGITLTTAIISLLKKQKFPDDLAMTGEITLRGRILAVGGLQEKLLAARRYGFKRIIVPAENKSDIKELNKALYDGMELIYVKQYEEVYRLIFDKKKSA
ncbi:MAG: endopeptidase La [Caldithrix sp.]|nr:endopeptidase La [Caldithrix sp.]